MNNDEGPAGRQHEAAENLGRTKTTKTVRIGLKLKVPGIFEGYFDKKWVTELRAEKIKKKKPIK